MNKKIITTVILTALLSISAIAQDKLWTLEECVNYALENNITVRKGTNVLLSNEQDIIETKGNFLPTVNASAIRV